MMTRIFFIILGLLFAIYIIRSTTRKRLLEKESLIWLLTMVIVVVMGIFPEILGWAATILQIQYGPSLLFLISLLFLASLLLRYSILASSQQNQIHVLAHKITLLEDEIRQISLKSPLSNLGFKDQYPCE